MVSPTSAHIINVLRLGCDVVSRSLGGPGILSAVAPSAPLTPPHVVSLPWFGLIGGCCLDPGVIDPWVESLLDCVVESGSLSCWLVTTVQV